MDPRPTRRAFMAASAALATPAIALTSGRAGPAGASRRAVELVRRSLVADMLGMVRLDFSPTAHVLPLSDGHAADLRRSGINGIHLAPSENEMMSDPYVAALTYFAAWSGFAARHSDLFLLVDKAADFERAKRAGKIALMHGIQNASHFRTPADVAVFHGFGQRCATLTYNRQNLLGAGSTERVDGGVTDLGAAVIAAMNEVGMLVDVSHCGPKTTLDGIAISKRPVAITHGNCHAINPHPRNKTDEAIRKLAVGGGVMGITGVRMFVGEPATIDHIVDHIVHVASLAGVEHVGIGSDIDLYGYDRMPADQNEMMRQAYKSSYAFGPKIDIEGFNGPDRMFNLVEAMLRRGISEREISLILGGNFIRLLKQTIG
jgi:membrane dipeptidase